MNAQRQQRLRSLVRRIHERDGALAREADQVRDRLRHGGVGVAVLEGAAPPGAPPGDFVAETIVLRTGRPVLAIRRGTASLELGPDDSPIWRERLERAQPILHAAIKAVGRIEVRHHPWAEWIGTGWLVAPDVIVTNRHVAREFARADGDGFVFRQGPGGDTIETSIDFIEEFDSAERLEAGIDRVLHIEDDGGPDIAFLRLRRTGAEPETPIPLAEAAPAVDEFVGVIGYPAFDSRIPEPTLLRSIFGEVFDKKRFAPGMIDALGNGLLLHDCSTLGGNSGSALIALDSGKAVGLHFAGRFLEANYAVAADVVAERLDRVLRGERAGRPASRSGASGQAPGGATPALHAAQGATAGAAIDVSIPLRISVQVGTPVVGGSPGSGGAVIVSTAAPRGRRVVLGQNAGFDADVVVENEATPASYANRKGYDEKFLGTKFRVPLPEIVKNNSDVLTFKVGSKSQRVLKYEHFSVVMSKTRRLCRFSAVNIDGSKERSFKRPGWRIDPRIPEDAQIRSTCYGNPPRFARGHMTRREDPIWGPAAVAKRGNEDSMHVTNAVPQMQPFNAGIWLRLEDYALQNAREDDMRISVFTGPFLRNTDPVKFGVKVPLKFWKVIAFIHDDTGELCATGYTMSQDDFLMEEGVLIADDEFIFGKHKTNQVSIASIEHDAGLSFGKLADLDPFESENEGLAAPELTDPSQIRFI